MKQKLPTLDIAKQACLFFKQEYLFLLKISLPQLLLVILLYFLLSNFNENEVSASHILSSFLLFLLFGLSIVMMIIAIHRKLILNRDLNRKWIQWTGNEIKYMGWMILITICVIFISIPGFYIVSEIIQTEDESVILVSKFMAWVLNLFILYFVARWSLVLPSSAIGEHGNSLTWSWDLSSGNGWRLTALIALPVVMLDLLPVYESDFYSMIMMFLWVFLSVFEIVALSLSFQFLKNQQNESEIKEVQNA